MRCAIYARRSSDVQSENSTSDQIRECKAYIARHDMAVYDHYVDEAVSGSDISRHEYCRLKADAYASKFDFVVVDDLSRIGRDMPEFVAFCRDLADLEIVLYSVADGIDTSRPSSKIPLYMKGMMNEIFLDDLKDRIVRGLKGQVLRGYSAGGRIYGFKTEPVYDPSGATDKFGRPKRFGCRILINEEEAEIARRMFSLRLCGLGYKAIAQVLNKEGVPPPRADCDAKLWCPATIRSILGNKKYTGVWEYNKTRWIRKAVRGKRKVLPNDPNEWVAFESEGLRIVTDDIFNSVASMMKKGTRKNSSGRKSYLLSGLIVCAECGGSMIVQNSGRYSCLVCNNARSKGPVACSSKHRISRRTIESAFVSEMRRAFLDPDMVRMITSKAQRKLKAYFSRKGESLDHLRKQKTALEKQIENLLDGLENVGPSPSVKQRLADRERELREVISAIQRASQSPEDSAEITTSWVEEQLINLSGLLSDYTDKLPLVRNELRRLFPEKLRIAHEKLEKGIEYTISGKANPFNLINERGLQLSIIAVQGLITLLEQPCRSR